MTVMELLRLDADAAFKDLMSSLEGVDQGLSWARLPDAGRDYMHTDGSIYGIVLHMASVKFMYGSICFRNSEITWRQVASEIEAFEPDWEAALDYLRRAQEYWLNSWTNWTDPDEMRPTNWKKDWPVWQILQRCNQHDAYHTGQITAVRYAAPAATEPPLSVAADIHEHCKNLIAY